MPRTIYFAYREHWFAERVDICSARDARNNDRTSDDHIAPQVKIIYTMIFINFEQKCGARFIPFLILIICLTVFVARARAHLVNVREIP